jgi:hypothetical protein
MKNELNSILRNNFPAFVSKAIRELDGTKLDHDRYLEHLATELMEFVDGTTRRLIVNLPPRHLKTLLFSVCLSAWTLSTCSTPASCRISVAIDDSRAEPRTVEFTLTPSRERPVYEESPVREKARRLWQYLHSIEEELGDDFDEACEILVATEGYEGFDRARFKKVGASLTYIGNTVLGDPLKTSVKATADKCCKKAKLH